MKKKKEPIEKQELRQRAKELTYLKNRMIDPKDFQLLSWVTDYLLEESEKI